MIPEPTDGELVQRAKAGDLAAFESLTSTIVVVLNGAYA